MRVVHVVRIDAGLYHGGGEIQAERTGEALRSKGVEVHDYSPLDRDLGDLVHFFGNFEYFNDIAEHAHRLGVPYIVSPIFVSPRTEARLKWRSARQRSLGQYPQGSEDLLRGAKALLSLTEHEERSLEAFFGKGLPKFVRIPNGVEERFAQGDAEAFRERFGIREPFAIHVGTIDKSKNQLRSIEACKRPLVIVGRESDPDYAKQCRAAAGSNVLFTGPLPHQTRELADALAAAHVFILPSYRELFPLAALEATVAGCNLLLSNRWGGEEIWGEDASFVDPDDRRAVSAELERLFKMPKSRGERARTYLARFSWDAVADRVLSVYRESSV